MRSGIRKLFWSQNTQYWAYLQNCRFFFLKKGAIIETWNFKCCDDEFIYVANSTVQLHSGTNGLKCQWPSDIIWRLEREKMGEKSIKANFYFKIYHKKISPSEIELLKSTKIKKLYYAVGEVFFTFFSKTLKFFLHIFRSNLKFSKY